MSEAELRQPDTQWSEADMSKLIYFVDLASHGIPESIQEINAQTFDDFMRKGIAYIRRTSRRVRSRDTLDLPKVWVENVNSSMSQSHAIQCAISGYSDCLTLSQSFQNGSAKDDVKLSPERTLAAKTVDRFIRAHHLAVSMLSADLGIRFGVHNGDDQLIAQQQQRFEQLRQGINEVTAELASHNMSRLEFEGDGPQVLTNGRILPAHFPDEMRRMQEIVHADALPEDFDFARDYYTQVVEPYCRLIFVDQCDHIQELKSQIATSEVV